MFNRIVLGMFAAAALLAAPAQAQDVAYDLHNETSYVVMEFYTSPSDEDEWGYDLLGSTVLGAGES